MSEDNVRHITQREPVFCLKNQTRRSCCEDLHNNCYKTSTCYGVCVFVSFLLLSKSFFSFLFFVQLFVTTVSLVLIGIHVFSLDITFLCSVLVKIKTFTTSLTIRHNIAEVIFSFDRCFHKFSITLDKHDNYVHYDKTHLNLFYNSTTLHTFSSKQSLNFRPPTVKTVFNQHDRVAGRSISPKGISKDLKSEPNI